MNMTMMMMKSRKIPAYTVSFEISILWSIELIRQENYEKYYLKILIRLYKKMLLCERCGTCLMVRRYTLQFLMYLRHRYISSIRDWQNISFEYTILQYCSTCFGRSFRPSSGALRNCRSSLWWVTWDGVRYPTRRPRSMASTLSHIMYIQYGITLSHIAVTNKHTAKLHHVGSFYTLYINLWCTETQTWKFIRMFTNSCLQCYLNN